MFKPKIDNCHECNKQRLIPTKRGLCQECDNRNKTVKKNIRQRIGNISFKNIQNNRRKTVLKTINKTKKQNRFPRKKNGTGELELFKQIYEQREPWCEWCGAGITGFSVVNYHHIKPKSRYPELRLVESNIVKICFTCHFNEHNNTKKK